MAPLPRLEPLVLDRLEVWRRSRALVLTAQQPPKALLRWVYQLQEALQPLGFMVDPREFRPHLTLMRDYPGLVPEALLPGFTLAVDQFVLYESCKGRYRPLANWALVGASRE